MTCSSMKTPLRLPKAMSKLTVIPLERMYRRQLQVLKQTPYQQHLEALLQQEHGAAPPEKEEDGNYQRYQKIKNVCTLLFIWMRISRGCIGIIFFATYLLFHGCNLGFMCDFIVLSFSGFNLICCLYQSQFSKEKIIIKFHYEIIKYLNSS